MLETANESAASPAFSAVSDGSRRRILDLLAESDMTVSEIGEHFSFSQPALSQHLKVLRDAGLVVAERHGRSMVYRLEPRGLRAVYDWVAHYERFWSNKLTDLGRYLDELPATPPAPSDSVSDTNDNDDDTGEKP